MEGVQRIPSSCTPIQSVPLLISAHHQACQESFNPIPIIFMLCNAAFQAIKMVLGYQIAYITRDSTTITVVEELISMLTWYKAQEIKLF